MNNKRIIFYVIFFLLAITIVRIIFVVEKFHGRGRGTGWGRRRDNFWRLGAPIYGYGYPYPIISPYPGERLVPPYCDCRDPICDCSVSARDF